MSKSTNTSRTLRCTHLLMGEGDFDIHVNVFHMCSICKCKIYTCKTHFPIQCVKGKLPLEGCKKSPKNRLSDCLSASPIVANPLGHTIGEGQTHNV